MSTIYSYTLQELGRMGGQLGDIEYVSMGADSCEVVFRESMRGEEGSGISWAEGDGVMLWDETEGGARVCIFRGWVTELVEREADWVRETRATLKNDVAVMDAKPMVESSYTTRERVMTAQEVFAKARQSAQKGGGLHWGGSMRTTGGGQMMMGSYASGTESCWSRIAGIARWCPQMMTCYDHAGNQFCVNYNAQNTLEDVLAKELPGKIVSVTKKRMAWAVPPVCALRGRYTYTIPEGASVNQPGAFVYHVPMVDVAQETEEAEEAAVQEMAGSWQLVKGYAVPAGWRRTDGEAVNMRIAVTNGGEWHEFWKRYFRILGRTSSACVEFGAAVFEPMPVEEAYPEEEEDDESTGLAGVTKFCPPTLEVKNGPANYKTFDEGEKLYVLYSGSFPASSVSRANVNGLRFCKGTLKQYVWLKEGVEYSGTAKGPEVEAFFSGSMRLSPGGEDGGDAPGALVRYACLTLDAVFINKRRTRYQVATNAQPETQSSEPDAGENGGAGTAEPTGRDYVQAIRDYYNSTRRSGSDGTVVLAGVRHYQHGISFGFLQSARWNPMTGMLVLTTGRAEPLGMDALLQRQTLGRRQALDDIAERESLRGQPREVTPPEGEEAAGEESGWPMVAPSESANSRTDSSAARQEPFAIYVDDNGERWLNGGPLPTPAGIIEVEPQMLTDWKAGRQYFVKAAWSRSEKKWVGKILYKD